jgi:hypothetical protein
MLLTLAPLATATRRAKEWNKFLDFNRHTGSAEVAFDGLL